MASLGQLTAGIAHEINNPINFVVSNINPLKRDIEDIHQVLNKYAEIKDGGNVMEKLQEVSELKEQLDLNFVIEEINLLLKGIDDGANRTAEIVKSLRTFSRLDETDLKKADINDGLDSTLVLLNSSTNPKIEIIRQYEVLEPIECYAGKLNQLFMNVLKNAIQAVAARKYSANEAPTITITTKSIQDDVLVSIKDNGIGMDEATKAKIFEPFFTTKDVGEGTGLGLSIVYSIIEKHDGVIEVESQPGVGTEFTIYIPKYQHRTDDQEKKRSQKAERRSRLLKNRKVSNNN
jgi:signal transduction histidine kinase